MNEVIGRNEYVSINQKDYNFQIINSEDISINLRHFLNKKLKEKNTNPYQLGITNVKLWQQLNYQQLVTFYLTELVLLPIY